jgi:hypothetical protein
MKEEHMAVYVIASPTIKDTVRFEDYRRTVLPTMEKYGEADFIPSDLRDVSSVHEVARKAVELGNGHVDSDQQCGVVSVWANAANDGRNV